MSEVAGSSRATLLSQKGRSGKCFPLPGSQLKPCGKTRRVRKSRWVCVLSAGGGSPASAATPRQNPRLSSGVSLFSVHRALWGNLAGCRLHCTFPHCLKKKVKQNKRVHMCQRLNVGAVRCPVLLIQKLERWEAEFEPSDIWCSTGCTVFFFQSLQCVTGTNRT